MLIADDNDIAGPKTTTTVGKSAVDATAGSTKTTTVTTRQKGKEVKRVTTKEVAGGTPAAPAQTTTTTEEGQRTFLERVLGDSGLIVLQIAAAVAAAFLAGAVAQRILLGSYGGWKFGTFELNDVAEASNTGIDTLAEAVKKLRTDTAEEFHKVREESQREDASSANELAVLWKRIELMQRQLDQGRQGP